MGARFINCNTIRTAFRILLTWIRTLISQILNAIGGGGHKHIPLFLFSVLYALGLNRIHCLRSPHEGLSLRELASSVVGERMV